MTGISARTLAHTPGRRLVAAALSVLCVLALLPLPGAAAGTAAHATTPAGRTGGPRASQVATAYGHLPLAFEPNRGQADPQVRFLARGPGYALFLTQRGAVLALQPSHGLVQPALPGQRGAVPASDALPHRAVAAAPSAAPPSLVRLSLVHAARQARLGGEERLPGVISYFLGNDPRHWHVGIPTYARVVYHDVYPGIDQVFYGTGGRMEYDFEVRPGANPAAIQLQVSGATATRDGVGNLVLRTAAGTLVQQAPMVYQQAAGAHVRVAGRYVPAGAGRMRLALGRYDRQRTLVIDPQLSYATFLGGSTSTYGDGIAVDGAGDAYVTGSTSSTDFPVTPGTSPKLTTTCATRSSRSGTAMATSPSSACRSPNPSSSTARLSSTSSARLALVNGRVQVSPLGRWLTVGRTFAPVPAVGNTPGRLCFPSTGHLLTGRFLRYWQAHNGSVVFGPPIAEPLQEVIGDGTGRSYLVQYFAAARLEYHPELPAAYQVTVGQLGREYLHLRGLL